MDEAKLMQSPEFSLNRRAMLGRCGMGVGRLGLTGLLHDEGLLGETNPLRSKTPHFLGKAKSVIWIFVNGGPSQVDTWDYKPALEKMDGKTMEGFDRFTGFFANAVGGLMKSPFEFTRRGECGKKSFLTWESTSTKCPSSIQGTLSPITTVRPCS